MLKRTIATVAALVAAVGLVSCSSTNNFNKVPKNTGFFQHLTENKDRDVPVDAYWGEGMTNQEWDQRVTGADARGVSLRVAPVTLNYMVNRPSTAKEMQELVELKQYFDKKLMNEFQKLSADSRNHFHLVQQGGPGVFTMETAILSAKPVVVSKNAALKVVGMATGAGFVTDRILGKDDDKGSICIACRIKNPSGRVVSETAKYMTGQSSILGYDLKDFQSYAHHKACIDDWVKLAADSFVMKSDDKLSLPWFKLNPF